MTITIAHLTDLHLGPLPALRLRDANVKRALGMVNWARKRQRLHKGHVFERMLAAVHAAAPDHIVVTGDIVNIGLPAEHERAVAVLAAIGPPDRVSVVPGNHDIYCRLWRDPGVGRWRAYMTGTDDLALVGASKAVIETAPDGRERRRTSAWVAAYAAMTGGKRAIEFPYVRRLGDVALIGVNSAVPTPPGIAQGEVGPAQLRRLERILKEMGQADLFRLVMIHHPPMPGQAPWQRALRDAEALMACFQEAGVELVVHGHNHRDSFERFSTPSDEAAVVGVGSASMAHAHGGEPAARAAIYRIRRERMGWRASFTRLGYDPVTDRVDPIEDRAIDLG